MTLPEPFAPERTARRRAVLVDLLLREHGGTPLLVTDPVNVRYLSGFDGSNGSLLVGADRAELFTDFRYLEQAERQAPGLPVRRARDVVAAPLRDSQPVLLEGHHVTASAWVALAEEHRGIGLAPDLVGQLRVVKDEAELAALQHACEVSQAALQQVLTEGVAGRSERELARRLEHLLADGEGEGPGFPSIVAAGPNGALPHHQPSRRQVEPGDLLTIDFGARVRGYHADITRTFIVGRQPQPWQADLHGLVEQAQAAALAVVRARAEIALVDAAARDHIAAAGHGEHFGHGLGHGVGLQIHERPLIGPRAAGTLVSGTAITIEPGVYLPARGGVRIEDTIVVAEQGHRSLVALPRELQRVD
jgi:Xaa-Pro aminopeptidase